MTDMWRSRFNEETIDPKHIEDIILNIDDIQNIDNPHKLNAECERQFNLSRGYFYYIKANDEKKYKLLLIIGYQDYKLYMKYLRKAFHDILKTLKINRVYQKCYITNFGGTRRKATSMRITLGRFIKKSNNRGINFDRLVKYINMKNTFKNECSLYLEHIKHNL